MPIGVLTPLGRTIGGWNRRSPELARQELTAELHYNHPLVDRD